MLPLDKFGAKGDGKADDTAALERFFMASLKALFDARSTFKVELPAGIYRVNRPIVLKRPR